ncbi:MAG TPA: hypothetical protein VEK84_17255 [Terriglobales bacterium]|nr:hypothetical protein [Terriglobales bacterium]
MKPLRTRLRLLVLAVALPLTCATAQNKTVVLKLSWVDAYKDKATIAADFIVDHAHAHPNPPSRDGDMHVAGRAPRHVGLPVVAEIMNAAGRAEAKAVALVHDSEGRGQTIPVTGAWRLWFEHPADSQVQFDEFPAAENTNPDHSFEIHPLTHVGDKDVSEGFQFIANYQAKDARQAFASYEKLPVMIQSSSSAVTLSSTKSGFNYVEFSIRLIGKPDKLTDDGLVALADVYAGERDEDPIAEKIRMIFVPNTPPWKKLKQAGAGDGSEFRVLGIPRVDLHGLALFIKAAGQTSVTRKLPYEMIVVGMK